MIPKIEYKAKKVHKYQPPDTSLYRETSSTYNHYFDDFPTKIQNIYKIQILRNHIFHSKCNTELQTAKIQYQKINQEYQAAVESLERQKQKETVRKQLQIIEQTMNKYQGMINQLYEQLKQETQELNQIQKQKEEIKGCVKGQWKKRVSINEIERQLVESRDVNVEKPMRMKTQLGDGKNDQTFMTDMKLGYSRSSRYSKYSKDKENNRVINEMKKKINEHRKLIQPKQSIDQQRLLKTLADLKNKHSKEKQKQELFKLFINYLKTINDEDLGEVLRDNKKYKKSDIERVIRNKIKVINHIVKWHDRKVQKVDIWGDQISQIILKTSQLLRGRQ